MFGLRSCSVLVGFAAFCSLFLAVPAHATTVSTATFSDDTFLNSNWSASQTYESVAGQSFTAEQWTTDGNPANSRLNSLYTTNDGAENVTNVFLGGTFSPSSLADAGNPNNDGKITGINWSLDGKLIAPPGLAGLSFWFIIEQGVDQNGHPVIFQSNNVGSELGDSVITSTNWNTFHEEALVASNWTSNQTVNPGAPLHPNYTATGGTMKFGFEVSSYPQSPSGLIYYGDFDNFSVDIADINPNITPEPITLSLLAIGGMALLRRRNK